MSRAERVRAERCFALARSTTFPGERDNAVARGTAICEKAGLDLDDFDIPGRTPTGPRKPPRSAFREDLFRQGRAPDRYSVEDVADLMAAFRRATAQAAREEAEAFWAREAAGFAADYEKRKGPGK